MANLLQRRLRTFSLSDGDVLDWAAKSVPAPLSCLSFAFTISLENTGLADIQVERLELLQSLQIGAQLEGGHVFVPQGTSALLVLADALYMAGPTAVPSFGDLDLVDVAVGATETITIPVYLLFGGANMLTCRDDLCLDTRTAATLIGTLGYNDPAIADCTVSVSCALDAWCDPNASGRIAPLWSIGWCSGNQTSIRQGCSPSLYAALVMTVIGGFSATDLDYQIGSRLLFQGMNLDRLAELFAVRGFSAGGALQDGNQNVSSACVYSAGPEASLLRPMLGMHVLEQTVPTAGSVFLWRRLYPLSVEAVAERVDVPPEAANLRGVQATFTAAASTPPTAFRDGMRNGLNAHPYAPLKVAAPHVQQAQAGAVGAEMGAVALVNSSIARSYAK